MFRLLFSIALAVAAYFGPWVAASDAGQPVVTGEEFARPTVDCVRALTFRFSETCAPRGDIAGTLITAAVILGGVSACLAILALVPGLRRLSGLVAGLAGVGGLAALAVTAGVNDWNVGDLRWGAYATGLFGLLLLATRPRRRITAK